MFKIYFAGPDLFFDGYEAKKAHIRKLCADKGIQPLFPGDSFLSGAEEIFHENVRLIDEADGVIANLSAFRSEVEQDSGTVFECGFAYAQKKAIIGYTDDSRPMIEKVKNSQYAGETRFVEDFGLPLNLMISQALVFLVDSVDEAISLFTPSSNSEYSIM